MDPGRLFHLFRTTREPHYLGQVFDLVADELFAVALHLARDLGDAEDLLQETFLAAIEHAARYDAAQPLGPWLFGILHNQARVQRRRRRRRLEPDRVHAAAPPGPLRIVLAVEAERAVKEAVAAMPQPYKQVLELRLLHDMDGLAIARRLGRAPGTVRTQLWRALELLRKALPKGLALTLGVQLIARPGVAAVRARVLDVAARASEVHAAIALSARCAGMLATKTAAIVAAAVLVLAGGMLVHLAARRDEPAAASRVAIPVEPAVEQHETHASATAAAVPDRKPLAPATAVPASTPTPEPSPPASAARFVLQVRVVDTQGAAVASATVEARPNQEAIPLFAQTDATGRCTLVPGATAAHVTARKEGVGESPMRLVRGDWPEARGEVRLILVPAVEVRGIVRTRDGEPASGATVQAEPRDLRVDVPLRQRPHTVADAHGRFALRLFDIATWWLVARLDDRDSDHVRVPTPGDRGHVELELRLQPRVPLQGLVRDARGQPAAGATVELAYVGGAERPEFAELPSPLRTVADGEGSFAVELPRPGTYHAIARAPEHAFAFAALRVAADRLPPVLVLQLEPAAVLAGRVVDERGVPLPDVEVSARPLAADADAAVGLASLALDAASCRTAADGAFRLPAHPRTRYALCCRPSAANLALTCAPFEAVAGTVGIVLVVQDAALRGCTLTGTVVAADGAPVTGYGLRLLAPPDLQPIAGAPVAVDAASGRFRIGPLSLHERYVLLAEPSGWGPLQQQDGLLPALLAVEPAGAAGAGDREVCVRLGAFATLTCRVRRPGGAPFANVLITLQGTDPRFAGWSLGRRTTGDDGEVHWSQLLPGEYVLVARAAGDPGVVLRRRIELRSNERASIQLRSSDG